MPAEIARGGGVGGEAAAALGGGVGGWIGIHHAGGSCRFVEVTLLYHHGVREFTSSSSARRQWLWSRWPQLDGGMMCCAVRMY